MIGEKQAKFILKILAIDYCTKINQKINNKIKTSLKM